MHAREDRARSGDCHSFCMRPAPCTSRANFPLRGRHPRPAVPATSTLFLRVGIRRAFSHTIAIEPNPHLLTQLKQAIPQAEAIEAPILAADPEAQGDFVLCSHTLYYIPAEEWLVHLDRLVSWMSPTGVTAVVVQNRDTACMAMLDHFFDHRFDLQQLAQAFREKHGDRYDVVITLDPAHVETRDAASAYAIAECMLNLLPISRPPARHSVEDYLAKHCLLDGTYRLSVHQDFLQIRSRERDVRS